MKLGGAILGCTVLTGTLNWTAATLGARAVVVGAGAVVAGAGAVVAAAAVLACAVELALALSASAAAALAASAASCWALSAAAAAIIASSWTLRAAAAIPAAFDVAVAEVKAFVKRIFLLALTNFSRAGLYALLGSGSLGSRGPVSVDSHLTPSRCQSFLTA